MQREKKFFAPELKTYGNDLSKRWRVEWWVPTANGRGKRAAPIYGDINKGTTIEDRYNRAKKIISEIKFDRPKPLNILQQAIHVNSIDWKPKTISAYNTVINSFSKFCKKPERATTATIQDYLSTIRDSGKSRNTIAKYRNTLFTIYDLIPAEKKVQNPVEKVAKIKRSPTSKMFFSDKQVSLFMRYQELPPQLWLAIRFLYYCFIRPGEQRHFRIGWINFEYGFIEVPAAHSKNKQTQKVSIPTHFLKEILWLQQFPNDFYVLSKSGHPGIEQISEKWLNDTNKKMLSALLIRGNYSFYSWKHTGAVKAIKAGINIKDLQLQLRHHSLDMVNEYLKNLGVMDSEDLRDKFPVLGGEVGHTHRAMCTALIQDNFNFCPGCGVKLKAAA